MAILAHGAVRAQPCEGAPTDTKLQIVVEAVRSNQGLMTATLYPDDISKFIPNNGPLKVWRVAAVAPVTHMCIWLQSPGTYALAVYHDENSNHKWDHPLLGRIEGFGFSNNPRTTLAPPPLDAVTFEASAGETTVHVRLRYP